MVIEAEYEKKVTHRQGNKSPPGCFNARFLVAILFVKKSPEFLITLDFFSDDPNLLFYRLN